MTPEAIYLFGSALFAFGVVATLRGVFLAVRAFTGDHVGRAALGWGVAGVAALALCSGLPLELGRPAPAHRVPVAWVYMAFPGWLALTALGASLRAGVVSLTQLTDRDRVRQLGWCGGWAVVAVGAVAWAIGSGTRAWVFRGYLPVTPLGAFVLGASALVVLVAMVFVQRSSVARGLGKTVATTLALVAGSILFGIPLAWQLLTSFKEQADQTTANGFVWVPRVQRTHPFDDPSNPLVATTYEGAPVRARVVANLGEGRVLLDVERPYSLRGRRLETDARQTKPLLRDAPVYTGRLLGQKVEAFVTREAEDGVKTLQVISPASLAGTTFRESTSKLEPVRDAGLRLANYTEALEWLPAETKGGLVYLRNTLVLVLLKVVGTLLSCALVGYGFSRLRFPGRDVLFTVMLSTMMLPGAVTMMPQFLIFRSLGWIDTLHPLWVPSFFAGAFNVFLIKQFFATVPAELEEAARIDGCGYFRTFWQVMLPQIQPALAAIAVWTFMGTWNDFMGPLIYISSPDRMPIVYALAVFQSDRGGDVGLLMAFGTMALTPLLLIFFFAQKFFIEGVQLSGLGGR